MIAAEPFFANTETIVRLDQTDAKYVDVIHSDISYFTQGGFGLKQKIGNVDFYPNGGHSQPGCDEKVSRIVDRDFNNCYFSLLVPSNWL